MAVLAAALQREVETTIDRFRWQLSHEEHTCCAVCRDRKASSGVVLACSPLSHPFFLHRAKATWGPPSDPGRTTPDARGRWRPAARVFEGKDKKRGEREVQMKLSRTEKSTQTRCQRRNYRWRTKCEERQLLTVKARDDCLTGSSPLRSTWRIT